MEEIRIGSRLFRRQGKTYVMGILNVTPDSFYDGGKWADMDQALRRVECMLQDGMDILDVGGESTRPGYSSVSEEEEIERVTPVIEKIKSQFDLPISLDTCKSRVAEAGIAAGADMINDIWGLKSDPHMAAVIAGSGVACCLVHNRSEGGCGELLPHNRADREQGELLPEVMTELQESVELAAQAGIGADRIILDPGIGFGKSYEQNLQLLGQLEALKTLGYPILLGCSRKSVIGNTLGLPVGERLEGTIVTTVFGVMKGCSFVRVHDVKENVRAVRMAEAILECGETGIHFSM